MKYLSVIFSIIFTFFLLEIFTRLVVDNGMNYEIEMQKYANNLKKISNNTKIGIEHKKNKKTLLMGAQINLSSNSFRTEVELDSKKEKILMIGDSMTFGWGASKPFANLLNDEFKKFDVINAGIGNTNTIMQIENFFTNHKELFKYKMIVLNFFINDFEEVEIKKANAIEKYSYLYTFIYSKINYLLIKYKLTDDWKNFYTKSFYNDEFKDETFNRILDLKNFCNQNNIRFVIHNIPELRNLKIYNFSEETKLIEKFSKENDIEFIDSYEVLKNYEEESLWVTNQDSHANDKAHKIIFQFLAKHFSEYR
jgi:hypothetical protein